MHAGAEGVLKSFLERCQHDLNAWNKEEFGHVGSKNCQAPKETGMAEITAT